MNICSFISNSLYDLSILSQNRKTLLKKSKVRLEYFRLAFKLNFFCKILKRKVKTENIFGQHVNFFSYENLFILFCEIFLEEQYYFLTEKKDPFIIDCGSNIGMSILYFKLIYPQCRILSFEPDLNTNNFLRKNVKQNSFANVEINQNAVAGVEKEIDFYIDPHQNSALWMSMVKELSGRKRRKADSIKVKSVKLSNYVNEPVDLLKLDVEGAEFEVIKDLNSNSRLDLINQMVIECHVFNDNWIPEVTDILNILNDNGFRCIMTNPFGLNAVSDFNHWRFMLYAKRR